MKNFFLTGLAALGMLATGCGESGIVTNENGANTGQASLSVVVSGENPVGRAIGEPSADDEKTVHSFTVYVFNNATGVLEATKTFTSVLKGTIDGLGIASQKKVVVLVNQPAGFPAVSNYSDFAGASTLIGLATQVPGDFTTKGLFMSGEAGPVQLSTATTVIVPVTVKRLVAKVRLGALTVAPDAGLLLTDFVLTGVSVQRARDKYDALGVARTDGFSYVGGVQLAGQESAQVDYLREVYPLPTDYVSGTKLEPKIYFYVFPNDNATGSSTLLNVYGTYKGVAMYFPFRINDKVSTDGGNKMDGKWVERNKVYTLNVTLKKLGSGGDDPNVPNELASMEVHVTVADWDDELIQEIEW